MITDDQLQLFGVVTKTHGLSGEVNIATEFDIDIDSLKRVAIEVDGILVPFYVETARFKGATAILVKFDGIDDAEAAEFLNGMRVYLFKADDLVEDSGDDGVFYLSDMVGFDVVDAVGNRIGVIGGIDDSTDNVLFVINGSDGAEHLVPATEEFIVEFNPDTRVVSLDLPDGLIGLN